jgi:peptidoglycan/xylan/chitin deacetylase (PgdA/CDA1 family)
MTGDPWATLADRRGLVILCYHALSDGLDDYPFRTRADAFARQLDALAGTFELVGIDDAVALWDGEVRGQGGAFAERARPVAAVTFDDAYAEVADVATPVLRRHRIAAGLFAARNQIQRGGATHLSEAGLQDLARDPHWRVGAHGISHDSLYSLRQPDLEDEVAGALAWLADLLGARPFAFAYPQGKISARVVETARRHTPLAFATDQCVGELPDRLQLRRLCPKQKHDDLDAFARLLTAGPWEVAVDG